MSLVSWAKKELARLRVQKNRKLLLPQRSLDTAKPMAVLPVQEVVFPADLRCTECERRLSSVLSQADDVESIELHVIEKKVTVTRKSAQGSH